MRLLCELGRHRAGPRPRWNEGYYFSRCKACGRDLVRTPFERWQVPRGYRVVWSPHPPENRPAARLAPAPPWTPADRPAATPLPVAEPDLAATPASASATATATGAGVEAVTLAETLAAHTPRSADPAEAPIIRSAFAWAEPSAAPGGADEPRDDQSIGEVLRILREEDARAAQEPEGGTIAPAAEPLDLALLQPEPAKAAPLPNPLGTALTSRRQRSRLGLRVAIATALALAGAAFASHHLQAAAPLAESTGDD